jgi:acyl-CoA reductase-like NAD-dependent aldehyde dehydrogenase
VCAAGSRLYVHSKIFDRVLEGLGAAAGNIRLGPGLDPSTDRRNTEDKPRLSTTGLGSSSVSLL